MTGTELLDFLYKSAATNQFASFEGSVEERTVDTAVIKEYLLKSSLPLMIRGAVIQGDLHLQNAVQEGDAPLPAIFLHNCDLQGALYLFGAKLKHLSLQNSRFRQLDIATASILGDLDCSNVAPFALNGPTEVKESGGGEDQAKGSDNSAPTSLDEPAYILGRGVRINGDLNLSGASLRALSMRKKDDINETEDKRWAAQLNGSRIEGSIHLNDCVAYGGIHLGSSRVDGDIWCYRLSCTATESDAVRLQTASIAGALRFDGCMVRGQIQLLGATVGALIFSKGSFYPDENASCIMAAGIQVANNVIFDAGFEAVSGRINLNQAHIKGSLQCQDCTLRGLKPNSSERKVPYGAICFSAQGAIVSGDLQFQGTDDRELMVTGAVSLQGIRVDGLVGIDHARIHCNSGDRPPCAVFLNDAHIGGGVNIGPKLELRGSMLLDLTEIGGDLRVSDSLINTLVRSRETLTPDEDKYWYEFVFSATSLRVKGSVTFAGGERSKSAKSEAKAEAGSPSQNKSSCRVLGVLSFAGSEIGHDFTFRNADFENRQKFEARAVDLTSCRISGSVQVENCTFRGGLKLTFSRVTGTLQVAGSALMPARGFGIQGFALDLESARVDSSVLLSHSTFGGIVILNFARIDGPLHILQSTLAEGSSATRLKVNRSAALEARSAEIQGELVIGVHDVTSLHEAKSSEARKAEPIAIVGLVDLSRTYVKSRFRLAGCTVSPNEGSLTALQAEQLTVIGSIEIADVHFLGHVEAKHMTIRTNLGWANVHFGKAANKFDLQHIKVEGALKAANLTHEGKLLIDVSSGSANSLNDQLGEDDQNADHSGWGRLQGNNPDLTINLQGFVYQSICDKYLQYEGKWWRRLLGIDLPKQFNRRLDWLSQSDDAQNLPEHHPQPYRRYSAVLRSHGLDAFSRKVGGKDGWREFRSEWKRASFFRKIFWLMLFKGPFGAFFGFGYRPTYASLTMLLLLAIGTCFVATAANGGLLSSTSPSAEITSAVPLGPAPPATAQGSNTPPLPSGSPPVAGVPFFQVAVAATSTAGQNNNAQTAMSCVFMSPQLSHSMGHAWASDFFYAVNLALPIVQLHEKTDCEIQSPSSAKNDQRSNELIKWHAWEDIYSVLAKVFTALALITFSGVLRRSE